MYGKVIALYSVNSTKPIHTNADFFLMLQHVACIVNIVLETRANIIVSLEICAPASINEHPSLVFTRLKRLDSIIVIISLKVLTYFASCGYVYL